MRHLILAALFALAAAVPASAHDRKDKWKEKLELTDDQAAKLEKAFASVKEEGSKLRQERREAVKALKELVKKDAPEKELTAALEGLEKSSQALYDNRRKMIEAAKSILTPKQQAKAALLLEKKMKKGKGKRWGRGDGKR